jgi:hypothetical protein
MNDRASLPVERPSYLMATVAKTPRWFAWWYRISCLPEPAANASLVQREQYRRARLVSLFIFLMQLFVITSLPAGFSGTNPLLAVVLIFAFLANVAAMITNRMGLVTIAGLLVVFNVEISMSTNIITTPHGLSLAAVPLFDMLVVPLVLSASLLPTGFVFLFAALNSIFVVLGMFMLPHAPDLAAALKTSTFGLVSLPIFIQLILAFIAFFWVRGANQAIARADRAEQIALLEHEISESRKALADQKEQLEQAIQVIAQALMQANQSDTYQRIPTQGNVLWEIAGPINNMISRLQRLRYIEAEHQQYQKELNMLYSALRAALESGQPPRLPTGPGKYALTPIYQEIKRIYQRKGDGDEVPYVSGKML